MNLALLTVQFGRLGPLNYSNICDRRFRSGERCRLLLDFTDGRADDSRDVSLLVSLFIVLVIAAPPRVGRGRYLCPESAPGAPSVV